MKKREIAVIVLICMFALIANVFITTRFGVFPGNSRQSQDGYTFNSDNAKGSWELLWEKQNLFLEWYMPRNQFVVAKNTLCYVAPEDDSFFHQMALVCIDTHNGELNWIGQADIGSSIANDEKQVYVGGLNNLISVYNIENGQKIWHKWVDARSITDVAVYDGFVSVTASPYFFSIFDASNGASQSGDSVPNMAYSSFASNGNFRFNYDEAYISGYDIQDNSLVWYVGFEYKIIYRPIFSNGLIIVRSGRDRGSIHVIDSNTGNLLWEKKDAVVGDFGINDTTLFFMTEPGEILAVDVETGEIQGRLVLNGGTLNTQGNAPSNTLYTVRAIDDVVLVYLGDTGQLFSFQYSNE
jgi:outer membrane protein assembly factor BamB